MYVIKQYTYDKAKKLKVQVVPSKVKYKKIDVIKNGKKICSIGDVRYDDYPTFIEKYGIKYANERRRLYKIRHNPDRHSKSSPGWYADQLLW